MVSLTEGRHDVPTPERVAARGARAKLRARILRPTILFLPTILAIVYFYFVAADRYVSEAQFVVRTASKPLSTGTFGAILQMSGLSRASDDVYSVQSFMTSRTAVERLLDGLDLRQIYGRPEADAFSRYPSIIYGATLDELHEYLGWMVRANYNSTTGISTLKVQAFRPEDAKAIADELRKLGEETVNRMNKRIQEDAIRASQADVDSFEQRLVDAQVAITRFRNAELMIDAAGSSIIATELIARLAAELTAVETLIRETTTSAASSPALPTMKRKAEALQDQIMQERKKIADDHGGLAQKLAQYERLVLDQEFAKTALAGAEKALETARTEGRRQQLYLEYVVEPNLPDYPLEPRRMRMVWTFLSLNIVAMLVGWLLYAGIRQHTFES